MSKKNKKNNKNENKIIFLVIAIILIIISFLINKNTFIRPIIMIISVIFIILLFNNGKNRVIKSISVFTISMICLIVLDSLVVLLFKIVPVFSYNIINYDNIRVYNSIGYRVWQCDKNNYHDLIVDPFYKKGYMCDVADTEAIDINSFLNSIVENYDSYKNNYIKIDGKISKKTSRNLIEMQPYEKNSVTVNGYVTFANNITLRILFNSEEPILDNFDIYDDIEVIGIVKNMEKEGNSYVIYMSDSKVVSDNGLESYTLSVTPAVTCKEDKTLFENENMNIYTHCIEDIIIDYGVKKYELSTALSSGKITIKELYEYPDDTDTNDKGDNLYKMGSYNVLVCNTENSNDIIIGNDKMDFKDVSCHRKNIE